MDSQENKEILVKLAKRSEQIKKEQNDTCFDVLALNYFRALLSINSENRQGFTDFIKRYEEEVSFYEKHHKTILAFMIGLIIGLSLCFFQIKDLQVKTEKAYEAELNAEKAYSDLEQSFKKIDNN
ncbi:hypothetical protein [Anaerorhabdus sp.]|uniref:hypothetical protein n=1 Tax=Anaerorhabdus sp. TaxID=1872524 RepID=UPI002FC6B11A